MSSPDKDDIFIKLAEQDGKILEELENVHEDYHKMIEIMQRRIALHRKYYTQSLDPVIMEIIMSREHLIRLEMGFLNATHDLQTDIAKLTSRIDDLESKRN